MDVCKWTVSVLLHIQFSVVTGTLRPLPERQCLPGFVCVHGYCNSLSCICDAGWKRPLCDYSECETECVNGTFCGEQNGKFLCISEHHNVSTTVFSSLDSSPTRYETTLSNVVPTVDPILHITCINDTLCENGNCNVSEGRCVCKDTWFGIRCDMQCPFACFNPKVCVYQNGKFSCKVRNTTNDNTSTLQTVEVTTINNIGSQARNVCSAYYLNRPKEERICPFVNFECIYGVCKLNMTTSEFEMKCICDAGSYGGTCDKICCLDCNFPNGDCQLNTTTNEEFCDCDHRFTGRQCQIKRPEALVEDTSWTWWVIGGSTMLVICLIIVLVSLFYYMWHHRVLMIMKIVHRFQAFEDGDDKEFDAFVSYRSSETDETFVYKKLYPKLEKEMGFRLCLHHRDFIPGDTIANNIIWAINNSRRTIIVVSPQYIRSDFTRFEYQVAQTEMLKRKHKIIPLLLEEVKNIRHEMDKNLRIIIDSVTYIKWPGEDNSKLLNQFWQQLQLSLPKKKKTSSSSYPFYLSASFPSFSKFSEKDSMDLVDSYSSLSSKQEKSFHREDSDSESFHSYHDTRGNGGNISDEKHLPEDLNHINVIC